jgi:hypothetical protein
MTIKEQIRKKNGRPTKHQQRYKNTGRPTVMTPEVVKQLTAAFEMGMSVINSCIHAGVSKQVYFDYCKKEKIIITIIMMTRMISIIIK